jgi:hypothetical protein
MRASDIKIGEVLRVKETPYYFKPTEILKPNAIKGKNYIIVKGIHSSNNNFNFGITRGFRPRELEALDETK